MASSSASGLPDAPTLEDEVSPNPGPRKAGSRPNSGNISIGQSPLGEGESQRTLEDGQASDDGTEAASQVHSSAGLLPQYFPGGSTTAGTLYASESGPLKSVSSWLSKHLTSRNSGIGSSNNNSNPADATAGAVGTAAAAAADTPRRQPSPHWLHSVSSKSRDMWIDRDEEEEKCTIDGDGGKRGLTATPEEKEYDEEYGPLPTLSAGPYLSSSLLANMSTTGGRRASYSQHQQRRQQEHQYQHQLELDASPTASPPPHGPRSSSTPSIMAARPYSSSPAATGAFEATTVMAAAAAATAAGTPCSRPTGRPVSAGKAPHYFAHGKHHTRKTSVPRLGMLQSAQDLVASSVSPAAASAAGEVAGRTVDINRRASDSDVTQAAGSAAKDARVVDFEGKVAAATADANAAPAPTTATGWRAALPRLSLGGPTNFPWSETGKTETPLGRSRDGTVGVWEEEMKGLKATAKTLTRKVFNLPGPKHILHGEFCSSSTNPLVIFPLRLLWSCVKKEKAKTMRSGEYNCILEQQFD